MDLCTKRMQEEGPIFFGKGVIMCRIQRILAMFLVMGFISICLPQQMRAESSAGDNTLFISLAEQGDASAQWILGFMYLNGEGMPQNYGQAAHWLTKAAEQGFAMAQFNLGFMYDNGEGVPQDFKKALEWYTKAAEQGLAEAQTNLGVMYNNGEGVPQDFKKALEWYTKAAEQGLAEAQTNLGLLYAEGGEGVPQDSKKALEWLAQTNLGVMYAAGQISQDYTRAYSWFNLAASQGNEYGGRNKDLIIKNMSSNQIEEGQKLSSELYEKIDTQAK
jgi:TPR repeat protein